MKIIIKLMSIIKIIILIYYFIINKIIEYKYKLLLIFI